MLIIFLLSKDLEILILLCQKTLRINKFLVGYQISKKLDDKQLRSFCFYTYLITKMT